ncbi:MAG: PAS domain-containing protein, partial [Bradyrhizobium icense]
DYEAPEQSGEAPAEFALFDAFAEDDAPVAANNAAMSEADATTRDLPQPTVSPVEPVAATAAAVEPPAPEIEPAASADHDDDGIIGERRHPLRFRWQTDREGRFSIVSDEFLKLMGPLTESLAGHPWREVAHALGVDADAHMQTALASRDTFSGITLNWPVDGGYLPVELSGVPTLDGEQQFAGYRGFGVCRDIAGLARLELLRKHGISISPPNPQPPSSDNLVAHAEAKPARTNEIAEGVVAENSLQTDLDTAVDTLEPLAATSPELQAELAAGTPDNVLPFRPAAETKPAAGQIKPAAGDTKSPALTPVENSAFNELARQLSARLDNGENGEAGAASAESPAPEIVTEPEIAPTPSATADWLAPPEPPARGQSRRDKALLDLLPAGVLIYRLDRLLYANPAFLRRIGYASLHALEDAGGLDALYVEPGVSTASSTSEAGTPVTITVGHADKEGTEPIATAARLHTISWDDEAALALICSEGPIDAAPIPVPVVAEPTPPVPPPTAGEADAEELGAILDTTAEGIVMFDQEGNINAC